MSIQVFIDGAEGTTGLRLADRLTARSDVSLLQIDPALRKDPKERAALANRADVVFLCLPDQAAKEAVAQIDPKVKVLDASTAHRTAADWVYGLPELSTAQRKAVENATRISVPGCHAMGFNILAHPVVAGGVAASDYPFCCHSVTGYSGGGKSMIAEYNNTERELLLDAPRQYGLGLTHKHLSEMQALSGLSSPPIFSPIVSDYYSGMMTVVPLHTTLLKKHRSAKELHAYFSDYYAGCKLVKVMPFGAESAFPGGMIPANAYGRREDAPSKDDAAIYICGHKEQILLVALFDNLGKGASGAAIQNMNLVCGFEETAGLEL